MLNAFTIDMEDWAQSVLDPSLPITGRVVENTHRVLNWLRARQIRATFFVLGKVCEQFPDLLPAVAAEGHEIGSHGYGHELVFNLSPDQFHADVERSIDLIESQIGVRPMGYRAPAFSITRRSLWAGPILADLGLTYSSSVFPIHHRRYGISNAPRTPYRWSNCPLIEFPMTTFAIGSRRWPFVGGGYTRLLPAFVMSAAIRRVNRAGRPAVVYLHPYEFALGEVKWFQQNGMSVRTRKRFTQELWRSRVEPRLSSLADQFQFAPMQRVLTEYMGTGVLESPVSSRIEPDSDDLSRLEPVAAGVNDGYSADAYR